MRNAFAIITILSATILVAFLSFARPEMATYQSLCDHAAGCVIALVLGCVGCWLMWDEDGGGA